MEFVVLGSGTGLPDPHRGPAGFAVRTDDHTWLVDGGSGTLQRAARAGLDPRSFTGGIYSHRHPDHCADLVSLLFSMNLPPVRTSDYRIVAGEGFSDFFAAHQAIWGKWIEAGEGEVRVDELPLDRVVRSSLPGLELVTAPANHSAGALHLRFEADGASVVFSGDTGPSEALVELSRGANLLVVECGGSDDAPIPGHLTPSDIRDLAGRAEPDAIWLTHFYPQVDEATALATVGASGTPVRRAADGDRWSSVEFP